MEEIVPWSQLCEVVEPYYPNNVLITYKNCVMTPTIVLTDAPDVRMRHAIAAPLVRFNEQRSGHAVNYRPLALLLRHPGTGAILGGLWGGTDFTQLHVDLLFVPESLRGGGLGRELMYQAEVEARQRDCLGVWLDTFSFQARGFYERLGYEVFGTIEDFPPGHSRFFLKKTFVSRTRTEP
jgi:GNAT superfamily N-acetyltransferase